MDSTLTPEDFLAHYGVKGMKWGQRKSDGYVSRTKARYSENKNRVVTPTFQVKTKLGEQVDVTQRKDTALVNFIASLSSKTTQNLSSDFGFDFSVDGKKVGEASMVKRSKDELYLNWLGVDPKQQGKGYGSAVFDAAVKHAQNEGVKKITLEVPGKAPNARHIYEKQGFKATKELTKSEIARDPVWGGLIPMELDVTKKSIRHSDVDEESNELEEAFAQTFATLPPELESKVFPSTDTDDFLTHYGVKGMKWGVSRSDDQLARAASRRDAVKEVGLNAKSKVYGVAVKFAPREMSYGLKRALSNPSTDDKEIARLGVESTLTNGVIPKNKRVTGAIEKVGIEKHKEAVYDLDGTDLGRLKKYTDAAWYSRSINGYLATGQPANFAGKADELKSTLSKSSVNDLTVYRSTSLNFSFNGVAKKLDTMSESELAKSFDSFSKNYKGKTFGENRVFSTSTSPNFAIDTWREVNPNAAASYNTYMVIKTQNTPGLLADGRTKSGGKIVNTRSNQEAILAPSKMRYESLAYDKERGMFAITVTALGDNDE